VRSFVFRADEPFDGVKLEEFLSGMIQVYGPDLLRYKGVLWLDQNANRVVFQGVHMLMGGDMGKPWGPEEKRRQRDGVHRQETARRSVRSGFEAVPGRLAAMTQAAKLD